MLLYGAEGEDTGQLLLELLLQPEALGPTRHGCHGPAYTWTVPPLHECLDHRLGINDQQQQLQQQQQQPLMDSRRMEQSRAEPPDENRGFRTVPQCVGAHARGRGVDGGSGPGCAWQPLGEEATAQGGGAEMYGATHEYGGPTLRQVGSRCVPRPPSSSSRTNSGLVVVVVMVVLVAAARVGDGWGVPVAVAAAADAAKVSMSSSRSSASSGDSCAETAGGCGQLGTRARASMGSSRDGEDVGGPDTGAQSGGHAGGSSRRSMHSSSSGSGSGLPSPGYQRIRQHHYQQLFEDPHDERLHEQLMQRLHEPREVLFGSEVAAALSNPSFANVSDLHGTPDANLTDAQRAFRDLLLMHQRPNVTAGGAAAASVSAAHSFTGPYDVTKPYRLPRVYLRDEDIVFATGSFQQRHVMAQATRAWRGDVRAFIATNATQDEVEQLNRAGEAHRERYEHFPDDTTGDLGPHMHGSLLGDTRAAMAPFLAHTSFGQSYKWMLYGDDDTVFYMPAVKRLLSLLDPELPIALSDNLWHRSRHPNPFAPRCLPCHVAVDTDPQPTPAVRQAAPWPGSGGRLPSLAEAVDGYARFLAGIRTPRNATTTSTITTTDKLSPQQRKAVQAAMRSRTYMDFTRSQAKFTHLSRDTPIPGFRYVPRPACPFCTAEAACRPPAPPETGVKCYGGSAHGGAGMIFSVGLLRRTPAEEMKRCYLKTILASGGDGLLSSCLWQRGYAFTDPGPLVQHLYDGYYVTFASEAGKWVLHDPADLLLRGRCDGRCKWLLRNAVSHHSRGRQFDTYQQAAAYTYAVTASHTAANKWLRWAEERKADQAAVAAELARQ